MHYDTEFIYRPQYKWANSNQHGDRFKKINTKQIRVARLSAERTNASDLTDLILLSDHLHTPIHYNFESKPQKAYIEIIAKEALGDC